MWNNRVNPAIFKKAIGGFMIVVHLISSTSVVAAPLGLDADNRSTLLDIASNGVPVVHIATPNNAGVSHNRFDQFNVDRQGLIFNNSNQRDVSQLGGFLLANPNLVGGDEAGLILTEVSGGLRSNLLGTTEVFGGAADLIVANPFGITCDGCGFVNIPRLTLATGTPEFGADGNLLALQVTGGDVRIGADGINASQVDFFDIVTRSIQINGNLFANDFSIVSGANRFAYDTRTVDGLNAQGARPQFAIDASALGGMYANRIRLVGTEAGVGVNLQGITAALAGDLQITAAGGLAIANASSTGDAVIAAGDIHISQQLFAAGHTRLQAAGEISVSNGFVGAGDALTVSADTLSVQQAQLLAGLGIDGLLATDNQAGRLNLDVGDGVQLTQGVLAAGADLDLVAGWLSIDADSQVSASNVELQLAGRLDNRGVISATDSLRATAQQMINRDAAVLSSVDELVLVAQGGMTMQMTAYWSIGA